MVGRKTSQRCDTCRKRRIKCDLAKPACSPCYKAGWTCPGYDSHALFHALFHAHVVEKAHIRNDRQRNGDSRTMVRHVPISPTDRLRSELVSKSKTGQLSARFVVIPEFRIMEHLPRRLGEGRALDDAVKLICASRPSGTIRAYGMALRSLQDSIDRGLSSETLGAATLLQMHDFFREHAPARTWAVHAKGAINMLKARGPQAVKTGFEQSLLQAQLGNITFDALGERKPCFLALPEWYAKISSFTQQDEVDGERQSWEQALAAVGVHLPGLLCRFEALQARKKRLAFADAEEEPDRLF